MRKLYKFSCQKECMVVIFIAFLVDIIIAVNFTLFWIVATSIIFIVPSVFMGICMGIYMLVKRPDCKEMSVC